VAAFAVSLPSGTVVIAIDEVVGRMDAYPVDRLRYYPTTPNGRQAATFDDADRAEYGQDLAQAVAHLEPALHSPDPAVRAGALLRVARIQRKSGQSSRALSTYRTLSHIRDINIGGMPIDLVARAAICEVLKEANDRAPLLEAVTALKTDLEQARWRLTRAVYDDYTHTVYKELGLPTPDVAAEADALAEAVSWAWQHRADGVLQNGRHATTATGRPAFVLGRGTATTTVAVVALPEFVVPEWLSDLEDAASAAAAHYSVADIDGTVILGATDQTGQPSIRLPSATGLPWTVFSYSLPADSSGVFGERGFVFAAGLAAVDCRQTSCRRCRTSSGPR
jgi:hypothetical protein